MTCNKEINIKNRWNRYCSFINLLPGVKNDTVWGVYLGCPCKWHDIQYSKQGTLKRSVSDMIFAKKIYKKYLLAGYKIRGLIIAPLMWIGVRIGGIFVWKTWSSKNVPRYK